MPSLGRSLAALGLGVGPLAAAPPPAAVDCADPAARVVILANASEPESMRLAGDYAGRRGVPPANVVALPMSAEETIGWPEFIATIYQPLQDRLVAGGWIEAFVTSLTDNLGRKRYGISGLNLSYLVVCRGVPLKIRHEAAFFVDEPRLVDRAEFRTNQGAVDSELTLLARSSYNINGWVPNPLFGVERPSPLEHEPVVKVSRLDGPTDRDALRLVDQALEAERAGLIGRYYVDLRGPHPDGERWLGQAAAQLADLGFDGDIHRTGGTLPAGARFDAPVLYFGWYADSLNGPMARRGFEFPPGAVALHIHSFSARTLRSATEGWCGPLVARGVTATFGNVFEPFLELTLRPDLLLHALREGKTLGDAAFYAEPALSWQCIVVGDPLYRPFAVPLREQLTRLAELPAARAPYVVLRQAHLLDKAGKPDEAERLLRNALKTRPGLVLGLGLARRRITAGDPTGAVRVLLTIPLPEACPADELPVAQEAARLLREGGAAPKALALFQAMLRCAALGGDWRAVVLRDAIGTATAAGDQEQASAWERELSTVTTEPRRDGKQ